MGENRKIGFFAETTDFHRGLQEIFFATNIACAVGYALCLYVTRSYATWTPHNDSGYYFLRGAVRVSDALHFAANSPVTTDAVARGSSILWNGPAIETTVVVSICSLAALIFLVTRTINRNSGDDTAFNRLAGMAALFALPACCLFTLTLTNWPTGPEPSSTPNLSLFFAGSLFAVEVLIFCVLAIVARRRAISGWISAPLLIVHFVSWGWLVLPDMLLFVRESRLFLFTTTSIWLIPSAGAALFLYVKPAAKPQAASVATVRVGKWSIVAATLGLAALWAIWLPRRAYSLPSKDITSAVIELSRGPCRGSCPVYTITIHGNGTVDYVGEEFVGVRGKQSGRLGGEEIRKVLQHLDRVDFAALEDRAFYWCFDSSSVSVKVTLDERTKTVVSDGGCTGSKSGAQTAFVLAADEIDKIVGSDRWVRCDTGDCPYRGTGHP